MSRFWRPLLIAIVVAGIYATIVRFAAGLGSATHLSDEFPWGLWIGFDVLVGVGLAAGGFVIAATVHIFQLKRYEPIGRPAILTAFLGYLLVIVALLFDLGRPYRIWHPLVMGNPHSVMFEVAMCVALYTTVLALEFSPLILSRFNLRKPLRIIRTLYIPLVIMGVLLSTLHQSSLGTLYVIVPDKLHPLWYSPLLPVFFFLSAVAGGLAMTIFESFLSSRAFRKQLEQDLLDDIARIIVVVLGVLLVWRIENLAGRGALALAFDVSQESVMFWGEMLLGVVLPMVLFLIPKVRHSRTGLVFGAMLTIMGFIINRLNVAITGMIASSGVQYIPSWMEFAVTASIVAAGFVLFRLAVQHLEVFPKSETEPARDMQPWAIAQPVFQGRVLIGLWCLLIIGFGLIGFATWWRTGKAGAAELESGLNQRVVAATSSGAEWKLKDEIKLPMNPNSPGVVQFNHLSHVDPASPSCTPCHDGPFPITSEGSAKQKPVKMDQLLDGQYCGACHNGKKAFKSDDDCKKCHDIR